MDQNYIGTTPWHLGSVYVDITQENAYLRFTIRDTLFGMKWNSMTFLLTPKEYETMVNKNQDFCLLSSGSSDKTIYQINNFIMNVKDSKLTDFYINFRSNNKYFDNITLAGNNMKYIPINS